MSCGNQNHLAQMKSQRRTGRATQRSQPQLALMFCAFQQCLLSVHSSASARVRAQENLICHLPDQSLAIARHKLANVRLLWNAQHLCDWQMPEATATLKNPIPQVFLHWLRSLKHALTTDVAGKHAHSHLCCVLCVFHCHEKCSVTQPTLLFIASSASSTWKLASRRAFCVHLHKTCEK